MKAVKLMVFGLLAVGVVATAVGDYSHVLKPIYEEIAYDVLNPSGFVSVGDIVLWKIRTRVGFEDENRIYLWFERVHGPETFSPGKSWEMTVRFDRRDAQQVALAIEKFYEWCDAAKKNGLSGVRKEIATIGKSKLIFQAPNKLVWKDADMSGTYRTLGAGGGGGGQYEDYDGESKQFDEATFEPEYKGSEIDAFRRILGKLPALLERADKEINKVKAQEEKANDVLK